MSSSTVQALAMDHRNDVMSNSVAIVCGYLGKLYLRDLLNFKLVSLVKSSYFQSIDKFQYNVV